MAGVGWGESAKLSGVEVTEGIDDGPVTAGDIGIPRLNTSATFASRFFTDKNGYPDGGVTTARGLLINWQRGPLVVDGIRVGPNGAFVEDVISAAIDRLSYFQSSKFQCSENLVAVTHLTAALRALQERTAAREQRGVEGTHSV